MIKVLQVGMTDNLGGIENYLINYYHNIDKSKIKFDFVNMYNENICFQQELENNGAKIHKLPNYRKKPISYINQLKRILNKEQYDVLHFNMNSAIFLYPLIAAKLSNVKVIIAHSHNASNDKGFFKSFLHDIFKHFIPLFANTFYACSEVAGQWFFSKRIINSDDFFVIKNAIDLEKFKFNESTRNKKKKELGIDENTIVIGHVGRFNKQKNHEFLIETFNLACKEKENLKLVLIGRGPLKYNIEKKVSKLGLSEKVLFLGQRDDVSELYQVFDIFALPSLYEGLPLVGIEAQCSGCYCIFSDRITKELKLSNLSNYININNSETWKKEFINFEINIKRRNIEIADYDIKKNADKIYKLYKSKVEKVK